MGDQEEKGWGPRQLLWGGSGGAIATGVACATGELPTLALALIAIGVLLFIAGMLGTAVNDAFRDWPIKSSLATIVLAMCAGAVLWSARAYDKRPPTPKLVVRCSLVNPLPIQIPPKTPRFQVLRVHPKIDDWAEELSNETDQAKTWPEDWPKDHPITFFTNCSLKNSESFAMIDLRLKFAMAFFDLKRNPSSFTTKDGKSSLSLQVNGRNSSSFAWFENGQTVSVAKGNQVWAGERQFTIDSLAAGSTYVVHLVNQALLIAEVSQPTEASALVSGHQDRLSIQLIRPAVNLMDRIPRYPIGPTPYGWKGVPSWP